LLSDERIDQAQSLRSTFHDMHPQQQMPPAAALKLGA
jgi:hypothetical protein